MVLIVATPHGEEDPYFYIESVITEPQLRTRRLFPEESSVRVLIMASGARRVDEHRDSASNRQRGEPISLRFVLNPPDAAALMMSARSFGNYDLPSALADLVDNSLKARARVVHISCIRSDTNVEVRIRDDGGGMSADALAAAMRPASANPEHERSPDDLGRFGWGLKSASFSQCRKVTVVSNDGSGASGAQWDLDSIDGWCMGLLDDVELVALADPLVIAGAGTEVIWRNCDRLSEN